MCRKLRTAHGVCLLQFVQVISARSLNANRRASIASGIRPLARRQGRPRRDRGLRGGQMGACGPDGGPRVQTPRWDLAERPRFFAPTRLLARGGRPLQGPARANRELAKDKSFFLIEIKSRPGRLFGDAGTWTWEHEGRLFTDDSPLWPTSTKRPSCRRTPSDVSRAAGAVAAKPKAARTRPPTERPCELFFSSRE